MSIFGGQKPEAPPKPRLKRRTAEFDVGLPSMPGMGTGSFQIRQPVNYEQRMLLAWANTDEDVRALTKNSWIGAGIDDKLEEAVEFIVNWNIDSMHPYWEMYEPNGHSFEDELKRIDKITNTQEKIRAKHRLAEDLMDFLGMELQKKKDRMKGFPEDEDLMAYADREYQ